MTEAEAVHALGEPEALLREIRSTLPEQYQVEPGTAEPEPEQKPESTRRWLAVCGAGLIALGLSGGAATLATIVHSVQHTVSTAVDYVQISDTPIAEEAPVMIMEVNEYAAGEVSWVEVDLPAQNLVVDESEDGRTYVNLPPDGSVSARLDADGILHIQSSTVGSPASADAQTVYLSLPWEMNLTATCYAGNIELDALHLQTAKLECSVGEISLTAAVISESLSAYVDCGNIHVQWLDSRNTTLRCGNGDIEGILVGEEEDYTIAAETGWGDNSLFSGGNGSRDLTVYTGNGSIQLGFEG